MGAWGALLGRRPVSNEPGLSGFLSFPPDRVEPSGCRVAIHLLVPDGLVAFPEPLQKPSVVRRTQLGNCVFDILDTGHDLRLPLVTREAGFAAGKVDVNAPKNVILAVAACTHADAVLAGVEILELRASSSGSSPDLAVSSGIRRPPSLFSVVWSQEVHK